MLRELVLITDAMLINEIFFIDIIATLPILRDKLVILKINKNKNKYFFFNFI